MTVLTGDIVRIVGDNNPFFKGLLGEVHEPTKYGAVVKFLTIGNPPKVAYYRVAFDEMEILTSQFWIPKGILNHESDVNLMSTRLKQKEDRERKIQRKIMEETVIKPLAEQMKVEGIIPPETKVEVEWDTEHKPLMEISGRARKEPSGDFCSKCGSSNMVRSGACLTCHNCGESTGC